MPLPRLLLLVLLVLACMTLGVAVVALSERSGPREPARVPVSRPVTDGPVGVLRGWDRRRAGAWAAGDVAGLRALYAPGSTAGRRDAARLRRWLARGLRVRRLDTQVLRAQVLEERADLVVLRVTDRIARVVASDGTRLPADAPSTWRIELRQVQGEWRVAGVRR